MNSLLAYSVFGTIMKIEKHSLLPLFICRPYFIIYQVLDASWYMPDEQRNPIQEYQVLMLSFLQSILVSHSQDS